MRCPHQSRPPPSLSANQTPRTAPGMWFALMVPLGMSCFSLSWGAPACALSGRMSSCRDAPVKRVKQGYVLLSRRITRATTSSTSALVIVCPLAIARFVAVSVSRRSALRRGLLSGSANCNSDARWGYFLSSAPTSIRNAATTAESPEPLARIYSAVPLTILAVLAQRRAAGQGLGVFIHRSNGADTNHIHRPLSQLKLPSLSSRGFI